MANFSSRSLRMFSADGNAIGFRKKHLRSMRINQCQKGGRADIHEATLNLTIKIINGSFEVAIVTRENGRRVQAFPEK